MSSFQKWLIFCVWLLTVSGQWFQFRATLFKIPFATNNRKLNVCRIITKLSRSFNIFQGFCALRREMTGFATLFGIFGVFFFFCFFLFFFWVGDCRDASLECIRPASPILSTSWQLFWVFFVLAGTCMLQACWNASHSHVLSHTWWWSPEAEYQVQCHSSWRLSNVASLLTTAFQSAKLARAKLAPHHRRCVKSWRQFKLQCLPSFLLYSHSILLHGQT